MGIDIASQAKRTAVAVISWDQPQPVLHVLALGAHLGTPFHDKWLVSAIRNLRLDLGGVPITKTGIDAPFGWPVSFVEALASYGTGGSWTRAIDEDRDDFYRRTTDFVVRDLTQRTPLAVSVDKIGYCAIRTATLLIDVAMHHGPDAAARDGSGMVCEVYPDPALRHWTKGRQSELGLREGYKGREKVERRAGLLDAILSAVPLDDPHGLLADADLRSKTTYSTP